MRIDVKGLNVPIDDELRGLVERRFANLGKRVAELATLDVVLSLDEKYKDVVYLYYYEGWSTDQISGALGKPPSTIRSYLSEARALLRERLGGEIA